MKIKLLLFIAFSLHSRLSYSQDITQQLPLSESSIFVTEETLVPLPITNSSIDFSISTSGKTAAEANSSLLQVKSKIESLLVGSKIVVINRSFSGGAGSGDKLSPSSSILINEDINTVVDEIALPKALDSLLSIPQLKITVVSPLKSNLSALKTQASSNVVTLALQKASQIAKDQSMTLGEILDITVTEEPSVASIRDQLDPSRGNNLSNPTEIKIVASLRIRLKQK